MQNQTHTISYKSTILACYIGNFVQAILINLTPIPFIPLRDQFGWSEGLAVPAGAGELALVPDKLKTALEDLLLDAGVTLLYAMRPVAVHVGGQLLVEAVGRMARRGFRVDGRVVRIGADPSD